MPIGISWRRDWWVALNGLNWVSGPDLHSIISHYHYQQHHHLSPLLTHNEALSMFNQSYITITIIQPYSTLCICRPPRLGHAVRPLLAAPPLASLRKQRRPATHSCCWTSRDGHGSMAMVGCHILSHHLTREMLVNDGYTG